MESACVCCEAWNIEGWFAWFDHEISASVNISKQPIKQCCSRHEDIGGVD